MKVLVIVTAGLLLTSCISTIDVLAPECVNPGQQFSAEVTVQIDSTGELTTALLGVLLPETWNAVSGTFTGPSYSGELYPYFGGLLDQIVQAYPPTPGYEWQGLAADGWMQGEQGEIYYSTVVIEVPGSATYGPYDIAFLAAQKREIDQSPAWDGDPCSTIVEVVPLALVTDTWGGLKRLLRTW